MLKALCGMPLDGERWGFVDPSRGHEPCITENAGSLVSCTLRTLSTLQADGQLCRHSCEHQPARRLEFGCYVSQMPQADSVSQRVARNVATLPACRGGLSLRSARRISQAILYSFMVFYYYYHHYYY